jgi:hypothetical protein
MYELTKINEYNYILKIHGEHNIILYKLIKLFIKTSHINYETNTIHFSAENVEPLEHYLLTNNNKLPLLSHSKCIKLVDDLTKQLIYLNKQNYGFYGIDITNILKIDDKFIFCSTHYLLPLHNDSFIFDCPINKPYFSSPEIIKLTKLPSKINCKCCYYSIGLLVTFCLLNEYLLVGNELQSEEEIEDKLRPLHNTKIYWFIKRCLEDDINIRSLLLL